MVRIVGCVMLLGLGWATQGCGDDLIEFTLPDGDVVPWGSSITIEADILEQGNSPKDGRTVKFSTTIGSFSAYDGNRVKDPVTQQDIKTAGGKATIELYSFPGQGGQSGAVTANYTTIGSVSLSESVPISIAEGGKPNGRYISARCDPVNIQALDASGNPANADLKVRCTLTVRDVRGDSVPVIEAQTLLESNVCSITRNASESSADQHVYTLHANCAPADVEPLPGEPNHMYQGTIHNPRDGLFTMVFCVRGEEGFTDSNGNGVYDQGEGFVGQDQPEPWVDVNDNGQFDSGEPFKDVNGDGLWSPADGRWSGDTWVWTAVRIMFTGPPHISADTTHFDPPGINIANGGTQTLVLYLMDENHNPLAAHNNADIINFTPTDVNILSGDNQRIQSVMGVEFGPAGLVVESMSQGRDYQVTLEDKYPSDENPRAALLNTEVRWTPAPSYEDYRPEQQRMTLNDVSGTAN
jgi:hypothetical protein